MTIGAWEADQFDVRCHQKSRSTTPRVGWNFLVLIERILSLLIPGVGRIQDISFSSFNIHALKSLADYYNTSFSATEKIPLLQSEHFKININGGGGAGRRDGGGWRQERWSSIHRKRLFLKMGIRSNKLERWGSFNPFNTLTKNQGWTLSKLLTPKKAQNWRLVSDCNDSIQLMAKCRINFFLLFPPMWVHFSI